MRPQRVTDDEILAVARKQFLEHGIQTPVQLIADELGLSQPALFKRFGSKRNLLIRAMEPPAVIPWFEHAENGPDDRPFTIQLRELATEILAFFRDLQPVFALIRQSDIPPLELMKNLDEPPPVKAIRILSAWLERCYEKDLVRKTDFRLAAMTIMGTLQLDNFFFYADKNHKPTTQQAEYLDEVISLVWQGLKNEE